MESDTFSRLLAATLAEHLRVMPVVVVTGARQTGKSTLAREVAPGHRRYLSLDELDVLDAARRDPQALTDGLEPVTLDEVQRAPELLHAVKLAVDQQRRPGQFLLTGSANLHLMNRVSESLAGRASYLTLWSMTRREQLRMGSCGLWEKLLQARDDEWLEALAMEPEAPEDWRALARRGGFPTPALQLPSPEDRAVWFEGYVRTYLERDLQQLSSIAALPDFRRLMRAACLRLGQLVNQTELARDVAMPQPTVHRYLNLLETSYLLVRLPAYSVNRTKRLIKSPKLYWGDTGLAVHLAGNPGPTGAHLENLVLHDLLAWRDARARRSEVLYWRTASGEEVDFVIEADGALLPVEVKATERPRLSDTRHLRAFQAEYRGAARAGLLVHTGTALEWLAPGVLAAPWWRVL
jgi:uncharacterized protein